MSYISKIIGKCFFSARAETPVVLKEVEPDPYGEMFVGSAGLSSVLDGMRSQNMQDWGLRCRREHGERIDYRNMVNGQKTYERTTR